MQNRGPLCEGQQMKVKKLLEQVEDIRREPLQICCRTPAGKVIVTSVEDAARRHCHYFHVVADDLDELLSKALK